MIIPIFLNNLVLAIKRATVTHRIRFGFRLLSSFNLCGLSARATPLPHRKFDRPEFLSGRNLSTLKENTMTNGTVKWFNAQKGFGFIQPDGGAADVFVHISAVERAGLSGLNEGQMIGFELERDAKSGKMSAGQLQAL